MFENLQDKLDRAFKVLKGQGSITEINVAETMKEIRKALLDADVNYKTAKAFTDDVKEKALGLNVLTSISPGQLLTKLMNDELAALMGGTAEELNISANPTIILIAGLNGAGKTTFSGKLANYLVTKKNKKPLLCVSRDFVTVKSNNIIWILFELFLSFQDPDILYKIIQSLMKLFSIKYTPSTNKKRKHIF